MSEGDGRTRNVSLRFTDQELAEIDEEAKALKVSRSLYLRRLIDAGREARKRRKRSMEDQIEDLRTKVIELEQRLDGPTFKPKRGKIDP